MNDYGGYVMTKVSINKKGVILYIIFILFTLFGLTYWIFTTKDRFLVKPTALQKTIPSGKKTFSVSSSKKSGPQFQGGTIDPYDPKLKSNQTISVSITSNKPVTTANFIIKTDNMSRKVPMGIVSGTALNGVWAGIWTVDDSYLYTYIASITATDGSDGNKVDLTLR